MRDELVLDRATQADRAFLVESIIGAEKSGTAKLSYASIFGLTHEAVEELLDSILAEDFEGQELCVSGFLIARIGGDPAGAVCSWIEGASGLASTLIKGNLIQHYVPPKSIESAQQYFPLLEELTLEREKRAIQLESVYVRAEYRGQAVAGKLISRHIEIARETDPSLTKAQIILAEENTGAVSSYEKLGFRPVAKRHVDDPEVLDLLPFNTKILMEKVLSQDAPRMD